jgi:hypothetical protein
MDVRLFSGESGFVDAPMHMKKLRYLHINEYLGGATIVSKYAVKYRTVTSQQIVNAFNSLVDGTGKIDNGCFVFSRVINGHTVGDKYYFKVTQKPSSNITRPDHTIELNGYVGVNSIDGYEQSVEPASPGTVPGLTFDDTNMVGRRIKIGMEHAKEEDDAGVKSWAEGIEVKTGDIVYSDGHYYRCMAGTKCGQTQPTHTAGTYSDGAVSWLYLHSGYGYITITSVNDSFEMEGYVDGLLPYTEGDAKAERAWHNYQWSMWGYKGRYPNNVFMFNGRLGYTLNTDGYGSWLQLSKSDEFDDFSVEEHGEALDTCAVNTLISEYTENKINWVISGYRLYMGSYAGEYNVSGGSEDKKVITPGNISILPVSQAGGGPVRAVKFEDLNLFASADRKQIFSLKYDYTTDDYSPNDIGFAGDDLLSSGIASMWHLRGYDRNLYLRTDDNKLMLINRPEDVKALGFFRVDMQGDVLEHCVSNANGQSTQFVLVKRGDTYTVEFIQPDYDTHMLNTKVYAPEEGKEYVGTSITDTMFAGQSVYVCDGNTGEYQRQNVGEDGLLFVPYVTDSVLVGIEMPCELHTHPLYNDKFETTQQKSVRYSIRVVNSGAFSYGSSHDFNKWYDYASANTIAGQSYGSAPRLMTGDIKLPSSFGYQVAQNAADSKYPNDTAVALSLKAVTPEPFNLLLVSSMYV